MPSIRSLLLSLPFLVLAGCGSEPAAPKGPPKHVLLIVIDTLRADHLSCYGYWRDTSPNIDSLAEKGVRFTRAISQSSWTAPSMVTLMTGRRVSGPRLQLPGDTPVLAELFKDAGYATGAWVANQLLNHKSGFDRGFDKFVDEKEWHSVKPAGKMDDIVTWLTENKDRDTFTWVHFTDPHDPYSPATDLNSGELGRLTEYQKSIIDAVAKEQGVSSDIESQTAWIAAEKGRYDDEIRTVDRKVRTLLMTLMENGNLDNAIVALTSDHGECLWERPESAQRVELKDGKRNEPKTVKHLLKQTHGDFVYQELVHVPLIITAPSLTPGKIEETVAEAVHLPSTLLALAGVDVPGVERLAGKNMFGDPLPPGAYTMTQLGEAFIAEDGWKLILPTEMGKTEFGQTLQLFNLNEDPQELNNLADANPDKVAELTAQILERKKGALPKLSKAELEQAARDNAKALRDLGYVDGNFADGLLEEEEEGDGHDH